MKRVVILISGGGSNMVRLVESMTGDHPARAVLVVSNDATAAGLDRAALLGVPTAAIDHRPHGRDRAAFEAELLKPILAAEPDILCLAGFMRVLTPAFVERFAGRMLNIHPSLLPKYPGLHTHARAVRSRLLGLLCRSVAAASMFPLTLLTIQDADTDAAKQADQIETFTASKMDAVGAAFCDPSGLIPTVKTTVDAGIPVFGFDGGTTDNEGLTSFIGMDNYQAGVIAGEWVKEYVTANLGGNAKIVIL
ncbi:hypothetical protein EOM89_10380, partial [Candidatus Falkowbacteria bacterium]|nr:hypothetical protein [Candidatus Falkowbacteria bacterium]